LKEEKITKPIEQGSIQPSISDNSSRTDMLPSENPNSAVKTKRKLTLEETVVSPEVPKATITVIRPTTMQKEESLTGRAADLMESMKDKTEEAIDSIKSATGQGVSRTISNLDSEPLVIPIIEQKSSSETKTYTEEITIEKKKVERKKNIEVKVAYDEIFVNGKEIGSSMSDSFREIKDKILEIVSFDHDRDEKQLEKIKRDMIPLLENSSETEKVIPLYAEQVVVSKRTVKVADLVIRKRKVTDKRKVGIDLITEQLTVRNPTGGASTSDNDE
jgi:stress response protein YsnF